MIIDRRTEGLTYLVEGATRAYDLIRRLGGVAASRWAAVNAEFKLATGLDATSPFTAAEKDYLRSTGYTGDQGRVTE